VREVDTPSLGVDTGSGHVKASAITTDTPGLEIPWRSTLVRRRVK
jgi:hypothetical protein